VMLGEFDLVFLVGFMHLIPLFFLIFNLATLWF
jgi:hypothetical protein